MIMQRKETPAFADFDNRQIISVHNPNLLILLRTDPQNCRNRVLVVANFNDAPQWLPVDALKLHGFFQNVMRNLSSGGYATIENNGLVIPALTALWLTEPI